MKDSDKQLLTTSAGVLADQAVAVAGSVISADKIALTVVGLGTAWGLTKALLGNAMQFRQKRAVEWVEFIRDNPDSFTEEILHTEAWICLLF